jgi:hypothetical protein
MSKSEKIWLAILIVLLTVAYCITQYQISVINSTLDKMIEIDSILIEGEMQQNQSIIEHNHALDSIINKKFEYGPPKVPNRNKGNSA